MPRKTSKKKAAVKEEEITVVEKDEEVVVKEPVAQVAATKVAPVEEEDEVAWVRKQLSAASSKKKDSGVTDIRDAINDPDSEFKFMPPDTNRSTASLAMVTEEKAAEAPKRGRKPKAAAEPEAAPPAEKPAPTTTTPAAAKPAVQPSGKPAWLLAQEKAQASRVETVVAKPAVKAAWTDDAGGAKKADASATLRIKSAPTPTVVVKPLAVKPPAAAAVKEPQQQQQQHVIQITPARVDMAVGKEHTSRMLPNQQVVTRIFSGIYNAEPCDSDVNGMF